MSEKIAVTAEELRQKKELWVQVLDQSEAGLKEMEALFNGMGKFFCGGPAERIRADGIKKKEELCAAWMQLRSHLEKLEEIAFLYGEAERSNTNVTTDY